MGNGKKETLYSFIFSLLSKIGAYLFLLVIANYFSQSEFGRASYALAIFHLLGTFAFLGTNTIFIVWYIKQKDTSSVFYLLSIFSGVFIILWILGSVGHPWILPLATVIPFIFLSGIGTAILKSKHKYHIVQLISLLYIVVSLIALVLLFRLEKVGIIISYSIAYLATAVITISLTKKEIIKIAKEVKIKIKSIKEYLLGAITTTLIAISFSFLGWIDSIILGRLSTFSNVAIYGIISPISNSLTIIPLTLGAFLLTRSAQLTNLKKSKKVLLRVLRISYSLSISLALGVSSILPFLFRLFFPKYIGNEIYAVILFMGILLYGNYFLIYTHALGRLNQNKAILPIIIAALLNIALDFVLIPNFGMYGITFATTFSHLIAFILLSKELKLFNITKKFIAPLLLIPLAFILEYWGLLLIPFLVGFLFTFDLIRKKDLIVMKNAVLDSIKPLFNKKINHVQK